MRNASGGEFDGPLDVERPWDSYTDDQLGLMDHLGIDKFMALGFCIGGPFIWNLLKRAPDRVVAAVLAQPSGSAGDARSLLSEQHQGLGAGADEARPEITMEMVDTFLTRMYRTNPDFVFTVTRDFVPHLPDAGADPAGRHPGPPVRGRHGDRAARAERRNEHLPVEGAEGEDTARGAPDSLVPAGAPADGDVGHRSVFSLQSSVLSPAGDWRRRPLRQ